MTFCSGVSYAGIFILMPTRGVSFSLCKEVLRIMKEKFSLHILKSKLSFLKRVFTAKI